MEIKRYEKLASFVSAFGKGKINLVIIQSRGGLGKTFSISKALKDKKPIIFRSHATPLSIYLKLYDNPSGLIIFDDVDSLLNNKIMVALLKQICETNINKEVYYSTTHRIVGQEIPPSFKSTHKVILICNDLDKINKNLDALLTRGFVLRFKPSNEEIFNNLKSFSSDEEILNHIKCQLDCFRAFNLRIYGKCLELKESGLDWREYLVSELFTEDEMNEQELINEIKDLPKAARNMIWVNKTGKSVRTLLRRIQHKKFDF